MAIQKVEDKNKLLNKVQLHPKRTYVSGSWGVSGSIYVFPNRSETQKDNIDERLNLWPVVDGTAEDYDPDTDAPNEELIIRPFSNDSLEARRIEIYNGNFNKFDTNLLDAVAYEYSQSDFTLAPGLAAGAFATLSITEGEVFTPTGLNTYIQSDPSSISAGDQVNRLNPDGTVAKTFSFTSNLNWSSDGVLFTKLPESDRDTSALNYEVPLALLLDGADPETYDHAYRARAAFEANLGTPNYSLGNSSLTGGTPSYFQFTGWNYEIVNGFPVQTTTITSKSEVNAWPPELEKWGTNVITNYVINGYSDLSMHPRNKTQKFLSFERADHEYFSKGSSKQRQLYRTTEGLGLYGEGWWTENSHSLSLSTWEDETGKTRTPCLIYPNRNDQYKIDYSVAGVAFNLEFWIKPSELQLSPGCVVQLHNNYAVMLIPDTTSLSNGVYQKYKISFRTNEAADDGAFDPTDTHFENGGTSHVYISDALLDVEEWYHVSFRWGRNFNNGQFTVYLNNVVIDEFDGIEGTVNSVARTGLIDISGSTTTDKALYVGAWPEGNGNGQGQVWTTYSGLQSGITWTLGGGAVAAPSVAENGMLSACDVDYQLKSELTELRCFNYPRTEKEIGENWTSRASDTTQLKFLIPFFFDWDHQNYVIRPVMLPDVNPNNDQSFAPGVEMMDEYYGGAGASVFSKFHATHRLQKTPYCQNWGFIAGVPFVHVTSHVKEYINQEIPVVMDIPIMSLNDVGVYPNFISTGTDVEIEDEKILYFMRNWKSIDWLRCWNSLLTPATIPLNSFASTIVSADSNSFWQNNAQGIDYSKIDNINFQDVDQANNMFADELWTLGSRTNNYNVEGDEFTSDQSFDTWTQEPMIRTDNVDMNDANELLQQGLIYKQDVLNPFSPVISIPVVFYGNKILEESISIKTTLASGKRIEIVDLQGMLFIANKDGEKTHAKVGHVSYEFGYLCIFSHLLSEITLEEIEISFRGDKNMHVLQFDVGCPVGLGNESKNVNYEKLKATANSNETDGNVTYISTVYLHDENLNVVGKVKLAQPIQKREEDSFLFRIKLDF